MNQSRGIKNNSLSFLPELTGIRAIAAFFVYFYHFNPFYSDHLPGKLVNELRIGVDLFFVLSGFLITYRYYHTYHLNKTWLKKYAVNRIARIYPAFFILTMLTFSVQIINGIEEKAFTTFEVLRHSFFEMFMNLTFLKGFFYDLRFAGIPQGWTLTVEECFYFSAPIIFSLIKKIKIFIVPILLTLLGFLMVEYLGNKSFYGFFVDYSFMLTFTFFGKSFEFCIGIWLAISFIHGKPIFKQKYSLTWVSLLTLFFLLFFIAYIRELVTMPLAPIVITNIIVPICLAAFFEGLLLEKTFLSKLLSSKLFSILGKSSYIFYLIHMGVLQIFISNYVLDNIWVNFIILNILAIIIFYLIEEPLNKRIKTLFLTK